MTDTNKMPAYECHKTVHALEIANVGHYVTNAQGKLVRILTFTDGSSREVSEEVFRRYIPGVSDFYVVYEGGYESFSPRDIFLGGYKLTDPRTFTDIKQGLKK